MRLLYICSDHGIAPAGTKGASIHLRAITRGLANLGHEVTLLSPKAGPGDDHPAKVLPLTRHRAAHDTARMLKRWLVERGLNEGVARELRPLLFNAWASRQAEETIGDRRPDAVIERLSLFGHLGVDLAQAWDVPLIVEVNAPLTREASAFRSLNLQTLAGEIETRVLGRADDIVVVSSALADGLAGRGIDGGKIHVVPNGVELAHYTDLPSRQQCRAAIGLSDEFVIGFAGSLKPWHGVDVLISAFERIAHRDPKARLLIVGTGPTERSLRELTERLSLNDTVIFTGAVPHADVPAMLRAMDVAVAPFRSVDDFYFSPIKLFEYMAAGVCVVASRLGQIEEVIEDGVSGLLCRPDNPDDLADCLQRAHDSAALRSSVAAKAFTTVSNHYTWSDTALATERVVNGALARRTAAGASRSDSCHPASTGVSS